MEKRLKGEGQGAYDGHLPSTSRLYPVRGLTRRARRPRLLLAGLLPLCDCAWLACSRRAIRTPKITVFKMDIQSCGSRLWRNLEAVATEGIRLVSGLPAVIRRSTSNPGHVTFLYDDILARPTMRRNSQEISTWWCLATGMQPRAMRPTWPTLLASIGIATAFSHRKRREPGRPHSHVVPGIFLAGTCQGPRSIAESVAHAQQAAEACYHYLVNRIGGDGRAGEWPMNQNNDDRAGGPCPR